MVCFELQIIVKEGLRCWYLSWASMVKCTETKAHWKVNMPPFLAAGSPATNCPCSAFCTKFSKWNLMRWFTGHLSSGCVSYALANPFLDHVPIHPLKLSHSPPERISLVSKTWVSPYGPLHSNLQTGPMALVFVEECPLGLQLRFSSFSDKIDPENSLAILKESSCHLVQGTSCWLALFGVHTQKIMGEKHPGTCWEAKVEVSAFFQSLGNWGVSGAMTGPLHLEDSMRFPTEAWGLDSHI